MRRDRPLVVAPGRFEHRSQFVRLQFVRAEDAERMRVAFNNNFQIPGHLLNIALPRGVNDVSNVEQVARYLKVVIERNPHTFRIFSPDELESNKLGAVLEATKRDYQWPIPPHNEEIS